MKIISLKNKTKKNFFLGIIDFAKVAEGFRSQYLVSSTKVCLILDRDRERGDGPG